MKSCSSHARSTLTHRGTDVLRNSNQNGGFLQHGDYALTMIGINWGAASVQSQTHDTGGVDTVHVAPPGTGVGDV